MATPDVIAWKPLGELLVERGLLTPGELDDALDEQARTGERLGAILVARKTVAGAVLTALLAEQAGVELETILEDVAKKAQSPQQNVFAEITDADIDNLFND